MSEEKQSTEDSKDLDNSGSPEKKPGKRLQIDPDRIDEETEHLSDEEKRILKQVRSLISSIEGDKTELLVIASNPDWRGVVAMGATYSGTRMGRLASAIKKTISKLF